jgi:CheY-like chemotaxis protein
MPRIQVVDDRAVNLKIIAGSLTSVGYQIVTADTRGLLCVHLLAPHLLK